MTSYPVQKLLAFASSPILYGLYRLDVRGLEHVPSSSGFVLSANHVSNFDPWPLCVALYRRHRLRFMAKSELYWWPLRYLLDAGGGFPVRRGESDVEAMQTAIRAAAAGDVVVMFPEGTRQRKGLRKKWQARPHSGAARIALEAGVPLVPAGIVGTDGLARLERLRVAYGPPVPLDDLRGLDDRKEAAHVATERLMAEIRRLVESL